MDNARFDPWTRRRVGLAAGGLAAGALRLGTTAPSLAKHKKKRCKKTETQCGK
jgi:hypothetical protein